MPPLDDATRDREDLLLRRFAQLAPDDPARDAIRAELITMHLPLVRHCAARFREAESFDDLVQVGTVGLIKAVDGFDPARGTAFSTYAVPWITGEIKRYFRDSAHTIRPRRAIHDLQPAITRAIDALAQEKRRSPTVREIAGRVEAPMDEVVEALEMRHGPASLDDRGADDGFSFEPAVVDPGFDAVEAQATVIPLLEELPELERQVVAMRFYGGLSQSAIAQELGISQMRVSRLLARSLTQMREHMLAS